MSGHHKRVAMIGRLKFVAACWAGQIFRHFDDPKPSYVAGWDDLPDWQRETDADIFERIEKEPAPPTYAPATLAHACTTRRRPRRPSSGAAGPFACLVS